MERNTVLAKAELFDVTDGRRVHHGANQNWFGTEWQRKSGCGPTAGAVIARYLARTKSEFRPFFPKDSDTKSDMAALMEDVWQHITPGRMGVNSARKFAKGFEAFARSRGVEASVRVLSVPAVKMLRPTAEECAGFIRTALERGVPVAWLNLHRGKTAGLGSWHWVTVIGVREEPDGAMICTYLDSGRVKTADFRLWLKTSYLGGGLATPIL